MPMRITTAKEMETTRKILQYMISYITLDAIFFTVVFSTVQTFLVIFFAFSLFFHYSRKHRKKVETINEGESQVFKGAATR